MPPSANPFSASSMAAARNGSMVQFKLIKIRKSNDEVKIRMKNDEIRKKLEMRTSKSAVLSWNEGTRQCTRAVMDVRTQTGRRQRPEAIVPVRISSLLRISSFYIRISKALGCPDFRDSIFFIF